jgi:hypothetical protein
LDGNGRLDADLPTLVWTLGRDYHIARLETSRASLSA